LRVGAGVNDGRGLAAAAKHPTSGRQPERPPRGSWALVAATADVARGAADLIPARRVRGGFTGRTLLRARVMTRLQRGHSVVAAGWGPPGCVPSNYALCGAFPPSTRGGIE
jgi:hypothetical protein